MALIVEDGTGRADAESYCSVAYADAYFSARNVSNWDGSDAHKEGLLRLATDFMQQRYTSLWQGYRKTSTQALDWPRYDVIAFEYDVSSTVVPDAIMRACAELAHRANHATDNYLNPDLGRKTVREKVDVIEVEYDPSAPVNAQYLAVDAIVRPYTKGWVGNVMHGVLRT